MEKTGTSPVTRSDTAGALPGLYIHIPFCLSRCSYCNFFSTADRGQIPRFYEALCREMALYEGKFGTFDTVYLGGGTPSTLPIGLLSEIIDAVYTTFTIAGNCEFTIEINPGDVNEKLLSFLRNSPLNRINLGIQSFNDTILTYLGRRHDSKEAQKSLEALRQAGFTNIGIDLIYGIPGQSVKSWINTLERALEKNPEHLSCYELTLEPDTPLGQRLIQGENEFPDEDECYRFFMTTSEHLEKAGYIHYEISNFARHERLRSRHNQKYWNHTPCLGLGPSAHSFADNRRWWNHSSLDRYCGALERNQRPVEAGEILTEEDLRLERIFLGLRTREGIDLEELGEPTNPVLDRCLAEGLLEIHNARVIPTRRGFALADQLAVLL